MIVVDTNVISYFLIPGIHTRQAHDAFLKDSEWVSPLLWRSEFRNVLTLYLRNRQMELDLAQEMMREAERVMQGGEFAVPSERVLALAARSKCSAYDCEFVVLAQDLGIPLVTLDSKLLKAFPDTAIRLSDFTSQS